MNMDWFKDFLIGIVICFCSGQVMATMYVSEDVAEFDDLKEAQEIEKLLSENKVRSFGIDESRKIVFYVERNAYEKLKNSEIFKCIQPIYVQRYAGIEDCSWLNFVELSDGAPHKKLGDGWGRFAVFKINASIDYENLEFRKNADIKLNEFTKKFSDNGIKFMVDSEPVKYMVCIDLTSGYQVYYILRKNNKKVKMFFLDML